MIEMAQPGETVPSKLILWLNYNPDFIPYEKNLLDNRINTVTKVSKAPEADLTNIGIPEDKAKRMIATAKSSMIFSRNTFYNNVRNNVGSAASAVPAPHGNQPGSAAAAFAGWPLPENPSQGRGFNRSNFHPLSRDPSGNITIWPHFRNVGRAAADALLANKINTFMIRKSSLFPNDPSIFAIQVNELGKMKYLIIQKSLKNNTYMYINENQGIETDPLDLHQRAWSGREFGTIINMVKTRFPTVTGPAELAAKGGRRKKHTRRHKKRTARKQTKKRSKRN